MEGAIVVRLFVRHNVADFDAWKSQYDAFDERNGAGWECVTTRSTAISTTAMT